VLSSFANALTALKESALEAALKRLVNAKLETFGSVTSLRIDSTQRTISAQLSLKGETELIEIKIGAYQVIQENGATYISFQNLHASREWIGSVLNEYVAGRRLKVPDAVRLVL
jgi:hypothetical protein